MTEIIKPVAWRQRREDVGMCSPLAQANRGGTYTEPLYDQQAIDTLRSEVEQVTSEFLDLQREMNLWQDEAEAMRKDAERYRYLRGSPSELCDAIIDAAMSDQELQGGTG